MVVSDIDIAWAAGFFDGEGSTFLNNNRRHPTHSSIQGQIRQVRMEPLVRFQVAVGGRGRIGQVRRKKYGDTINTWQAASKQICEVMEILWLYLSEPKREQFLKVLAAKQALAPRDTAGGSAEWRRLAAGWL